MRVSERRAPRELSDAGRVCSLFELIVSVCSFERLPISFGRDLRDMPVIVSDVRDDSWPMVRGMAGRSPNQVEFPDHAERESLTIEPFVGEHET